MSVNKITRDIEDLVTPLSEKCTTFDDTFTKKITEFKDFSFSSLNEIDKLLDNKFSNFKHTDLVSWIQFLKVLLDKLILLKTEVKTDSSHLFSLSQQRMLKSAFEIVVCLGILPHVSPGVGVPLSQRSSNKYLSMLQKKVTDDEKYYSLNLTLLGLFDLCKLDTFNSILINNHLGDMIAGAVQLILDKKAVQLEQLKQNLQSLIENTYQPYVIRALMVMLGNKAAPKALFRWLSNVLSDRLTTSGGLVATLRAILDMSGSSMDSPRYWDHVSVLAKLITTPKHTSLYPQLFSLLKGQNSEYRQVAVMSLKLLAESRPNDCETYLVAPLLKAITHPCTEEEFGASLEAIHGCCGLHSPWSAPPKIISSAFSHFIRLHAKIKTTVSYLKSKVADLAWSILSHEETDLEKTFHQAVFEPLPITFKLGASGGIYVVEVEDDIDMEDVADSILELFLNNGNSEAKFTFFKVLMNSIIKDKNLEKQLIFSKLLSDMCGDPDVQKCLSNDSLCIIPFIKVLLEDPESFGSEIVCLGLMVLGVFVDAPFSNKPIDWSQLDVLIEPLKRFKSSSTEANVLGNELYELIMTKGVVRSKPKKVEKEKTSLEKALAEAVDPLLPVRAHGMRDLGKLLLAKDPQALAKKENILFIFKENLKDEDSYIYLSSIEGLAALCGSFPDEVMLTLIEEFQAKNHPVEDRLKVGEVLVKVARILNEMAIIYKKELISCFLVGSCDEDPLMRASSLSNLGEICKILSFRITAYIVEILECVRSTYETDKHPEARRAAVMVLTLLLKGLGEGALSTLEPVLLELYRGLKKVYEYDKDDITRLHAQLALEELRASTLVFLSPIRPLEKRIFVLDPPQ